MLGACGQTSLTSTAHRNLARVDPCLWNTILGTTFGTSDYFELCHDLSHVRRQRCAVLNLLERANNVPWSRIAPVEEGLLLEEAIGACPTGRNWFLALHQIVDNQPIVVGREATLTIHISTRYRSCGSVPRDRHMAKSA